MSFSSILKEYLETRDRLLFERSKSTPSMRECENLVEELNSLERNMDNFLKGKIE